MKAYIFVEDEYPREPRAGDIIDPCGNGMFTKLGCGAACVYAGQQVQCYRRIEVELPTKLEVQTEMAAFETADEAVGFSQGVRWLADRLGITLEDK